MPNKYYEFVGRNCSIIISLMFLGLAFSNCALALFVSGNKKQNVVEAMYQIQLSLAWYYIHRLDKLPEVTP